MTTITTTPYGSYTHGVPHRTYGLSWSATYSRVDTYHTTIPELDGGRDTLRVVSAQDDTPIYLGVYDATCPCCWLHHAHSTAYHEAHTA